MVRESSDSDSDSDDDVIVLGVLLYLHLRRSRRRREEDKQRLRIRRQRQRRIICPMFLARDQEGVMEILINRHLRQDEPRFVQYFRLSFDLFAFVFRHIERDIRSEPTNVIPQPISPEVKLAVTLRLVNKLHMITNKCVFDECCIVPRKFYLLKV